MENKKECDHVMGIKGNMLILRSAIMVANFRTPLVCDILFRYCPHCAHKNIPKELDEYIEESGVENG